MIIASSQTALNANIDAFTKLVTNLSTKKATVASISLCNNYRGLTQPTVRASSPIPYVASSTEPATPSRPPSFPEVPCTASPVLHAASAHTGGDPEGAPPASFNNHELVR